MRANLLVLLLCFWLFPLEANAAAIHDAVKKGDIAGIAAAIAAGADVNESDGAVNIAIKHSVNLTHIGAKVGDMLECKGG